MSALYFNNIDRGSALLKAATWRGVTPIRFLLLISRVTEL